MIPYAYDPGSDEARKSYRTRFTSGFLHAYLSGPNVLDVGYRGYAPDAKPVVPHAIGVDLDYPGYDGIHLPFADASIDCVFSSHFLEHVGNPLAILLDHFRVLRRGGFLVCIVPHQFLYEKRSAPPSRWNADHKWFYTPASLLALVEHALAPNTYRVRHLRDNDDGFDYTIGPERHSSGCYEIELVLQKIAPPEWTLQ